MGKLFLPATMKKYRPFICGLLLTLLLLVTATALAADDPIEFTITADPASLSGPGEVTVSARVSNVGTDTIDTVSLYDPDGKIVTGFGDGGTMMLSGGAFATVQGKWNVTQAQLDAGKITYTVRYNLISGGEVIEATKNASADIAFTGEKVSLQVNRSVSPAIARTGQTVTIVYDLVNNGNVDLTDISVKENSSVSKTAQKVASLSAGESKSVTFTVKMTGTTITSAATISYKAKGASDTKSATAPTVEVPLAKPNVSLSLAADKTSCNIGDTVTMTLTLKNDGNVSYSNINVTDAKMGEVFTNLSLAAGETLTREKEFTMQESVDFKLYVAMQDNTGSSNTLSTDQVTVSAYDPEQILRLTLNLTSQEATIATSPADVHFSIVVTNSSNVEAKNISIMHGTTKIYTISVLAPSQSITLDRVFTVSQAGLFRFTASCKDTLGNTVTFDSNELRLTHATPTNQPTKVPAVTLQPLVTIAPPTIDDVNPVLTKGSSILFIIASVLGGVFAVALVLFIISTVIRLNKKRHSDAAYDHLELASRRDYTEAPEEQEEAEEAPDVPVVHKTEDADVELPHEKFLKSEGKQDAPASSEKTEEQTTQSTAKPAQEKTEEEGPHSDGTGAYRLTRREVKVDDTDTYRSPRHSAVADEQKDDIEADADAPEVKPAAHRRRSQKHDKDTTDLEG